MKGPEAVNRFLPGKKPKKRRAAELPGAFFPFSLFYLPKNPFFS